MARNWIVLGDATTSGGRVITASPHTDIDGVAVARVTDKATCPLHKGVFSIVNGDRSIIIDGQPVALHGASLECGCHVLAMKQSHVFVDASGDNGRAVLQGAGMGEVAVALTSSSLIKPCKYDQAVRFIGRSGQPLANLRYALHLAGGSRVEGMTDAEGRTQRVETELPEMIVKAEAMAPEESSMCCAKRAPDADYEEGIEIFDVDGIITTNQEIGTSVVSVEMPDHWRRLTQGEIEMARLVFGRSIDYSKVKVHNHGYWVFFGKQDQDTGVTPDGEMYFPKKIYKEDYSVERLKIQAWFIHEMTHVWQYQLGYSVKLVRGPRPSMSYEYHLGRRKKFCDYNMEAQGDILADYFLVAFRGAQEMIGASQYQEMAALLPLFEHVLSGFLHDPRSTSNLPNTVRDDQE